MTLLVIGIAAVLWQGTKDIPESSAAPPETGETGGFRVLSRVALSEYGGNDGDSFRIRHEGGTDVFRLYFVDTCEKTDAFPKRLDYQAEYFGGLSRARVIELGEEAQRASLSWLRSEPFEIHTRHERVMNSHRLFAMVRFPEREGSPEEWMSQRLVRRGLARIYTQGTDVPDGRSREAFTGALKALERQAREEDRVGAWSKRR